MKYFALAFALIAFISTGHAATPVPDQVETMIRSAAGTDAFDAVIETAKRAFPDSVSAIETLADTLQAQREQERIAHLSEAGIFENWTGEGEAGLSRTTGNTNDVGVVATFELRRDGLRFRHKIDGLVDWQRSGDVLTRNRYMSNYELNYKFNDRAYIYGLGGWERNTFAGFTTRLSQSFGGGYSLLRRNRLTLDVTAGPSFQQKWNLDGSLDRTMSARASMDFDWRITDRITFGQDAAVYIGNQFNATTALTSQLIGGLAARLSFDVVREANPPEGRKAMDTLSRVSLVYGF